MLVQVFHECVFPLIPAALEDSIRPGSAVDVPFGNTTRNGYVLEVAASSCYDANKLKELTGLSSRRAGIPEKLITLGKWMAEYYCATQEHAIRTLLPAAVRSGRVKSLVSRVFYIPDQKAAEKYILDNADAKRVVKRIEVLKLMLKLREGTLTENVAFRVVPDFTRGRVVVRLWIRRIRHLVDEEAVFDFRNDFFFQNFDSGVEPTKP